MDKKRTEVMLDKDLWWKLKIIAMRKGQTLSALFRDLLSVYVREYERTKETSSDKGREVTIMDS